jgi:TPR repeat protein
MNAFVSVLLVSLCTLRWGIGQSKNTNELLLSVLQRQAEDDKIEAQVKLANKYELGEGVPKDPNLAFKWAYRAAIAGNPLAA